MEEEQVVAILDRSNISFSHRQGEKGESKSSKKPPSMSHMAKIMMVLKNFFSFGWLCCSLAEKAARVFTLFVLADLMGEFSSLRVQNSPNYVPGIALSLT